MKILMTLVLFALMNLALAVSPKTIYELNNMPTPEFKWSNSALVLVDLQREYGPKGKLALPSIEESYSAISKLIELARKKKLPIIYLIQKGRVGGLFDPSTEGSKILNGLENRSGDFVIEKIFPDGFEKTELLTKLKSLNIERVVLAGYMTHLCLDATARTALNLGFKTFIPYEATSSRDLKLGVSNKVINAKDVKDGTLAGLNDRTAVVLKLSDLEKAP